MSDLKPLWSNPPVGDVGLDGDLVSGRGGDPNITVDQPNGLTHPMWGNSFVPDPPEKETANSVSGLPATPSRFEPSGTPPEPPSLQDRSPGTIDQQ